MNIKRIGLFVLSILSVGWLGYFFAKDFIGEKINNSKSSWLFDMSYKKYIRVPLFCTFSVFFLLLFLLVYFLWCSVLGVWFTFLSIVLFIVYMLIIIPLAIYLLAKNTVATSLILVNEAQNLNENDVYLLKMIDEEDLIHA